MKALFFLRHYNDIDHITPVVHKWIERGHVCDVVLMGEAGFREDFRVVYLASLDGVRVARVGAILGRAQFVRMHLQKLLLDRHVRGSRLVVVTRLLDRLLTVERRKDFWGKIAERILRRSFPAGGPGVLAFDWISSNSVFPIELVRVVVETGHAMGLKAVSLPHGDSPHANKLVRVEELKLEPHGKFAAASMFDRIVVPNELCATRFRPFVNDSSVEVLGSPRFCDEWLAKLEALLPGSPLEDEPGKLKLVMFLRKRDFSIFWDEVDRVVRLLASFPRVQLIVKAHTRGGRKQPLTGNPVLRQLGNVRFVADEVHSSHLLGWADVIIDIATSVAFEAVKLKKPVLAADYLHAGVSTVGEYLPECRLNCRDDVYVAVEKFLREGCGNFYVDEHRCRFLTEIVDVPDPAVLPRYVHLLESQAA
ncbi:MAG: hypothetical protein ACE5G3_00290 [Gammaproteobacteria bacterium]